MREAYDLLILGGGAAGSEAAFTVADGGRTRILLVESHHFGGTCTNHGCVPTKALVKAARVAHAMRSATEFGFNPVEVSFDWDRIVARTHRVRDHMLRFGRKPFDEAGVEVAFPAEARLVGRQRVAVDGREVECRAVLLAT
ncbi:MAG: FAD-dependent oxidoreductase, partial [Candidatus Dormibacteraeota bacterium]|nr:FAD-dependent oxidoreductase [Candidatus Dormibacteraeota bacterium]